MERQDRAKTAVSEIEEGSELYVHIEDIKSYI